MTLRPELIDKLFFEIKQTGTNDIKIEYLNLPKYVRPKLNELLKTEPKDVQDIYATSQLQQYRDEIEPMLRANLAKHGLTLRFDEIIHHTTNQNLKEK